MVDKTDQRPTAEAYYDAFLDILAERDRVDFPHSGRHLEEKIGSWR